MDLLHFAFPFSLELLEAVAYAFHLVVLVPVAEDAVDTDQHVLFLAEGFVPLHVLSALR